MMIGLAIIGLAMVLAAYIVFTGVTRQTFNYFGRRLTRNGHPFLFWFGMAIALLVLINGAWMLPLWLAALK